MWYLFYFVVNCGLNFIITQTLKVMQLVQTDKTWECCLVGVGRLVALGKFYCICFLSAFIFTSMSSRHPLLNMLLNYQNGIYLNNSLLIEPLWNQVTTVSHCLMLFLRFCVCFLYEQFSTEIKQGVGGPCSKASVSRTTILPAMVNPEYRLKSV